MKRPDQLLLFGLMALGPLGHLSTTPSRAACPPPVSGPTMHDGNVDKATWTAAASPHIVRYDINITGTLGCKQSDPRDTDGSCPKPAPCPK